jgi:hypothetical protein
MAVAPIVDARSTAAASPDATDRWAPSRRPSGSTDASYDAGTMAHDADQPVPRRPRPEPGIGPAGETLPTDVAKVLRAFFRDDRLATIPANATKRRTVLVYLLDRCFPEDRVYPEKEVNQRLALFHPDVAALRRYMVDGGLMTRANGEYRRRPEPTER